MQSHARLCGGLYARRLIFSASLRHASICCVGSAGGSSSSRVSGRPITRCQCQVSRRWRSITRCTSARSSCGAGASSVVVSVGSGSGPGSACSVAAPASAPRAHAHASRSVCLCRIRDPPRIRAALSTVPQSRAALVVQVVGRSPPRRVSNHSCRLSQAPPVVGLPRSGAFSRSPPKTSCGCTTVSPRAGELAHGRDARAPELWVPAADGALDEPPQFPAGDDLRRPPASVGSGHMAGKRYLLTPGPTPVPPEVLAALAEPVIHHRARDYRQIYERCLARLRDVYRTQNDVLMFTTSGTGAFESAVANLTSPGDRQLVLSAGNFGERWAGMVQAFGAELTHLRLEWGETPEPDDLRSALAGGDVRVVYLTHSETSTGVVCDVQALASVAREAGAFVVVDGVSSLGAVPLETDAWEIDVVVSGSQKALMCPPGVAFVSVSATALEAASRAGAPRYVLD